MPPVGAFLSGAFSFLATGAVAGAGVAGAWAAGAATASFLTTTVLGKLLTTVALTALSRALAPKPRQPGLVTEATTTGEEVSQGAILGWYATAGHHLCPPMTHGTRGKTKNAYLTYVVALSDLPGCQLERLVINDEVVGLGTTPDTDGFLPATGDMAGYLWLKLHDGSQAAADPWLLATYGPGTAHAIATGRPWQADMVGPGLCYAILRFRYDRKRFNSLPKVLFELTGIPLYDPRRDSSVGGSGTHRWADPATWEPSANPIVQVYNILRGLEIPQSGIWGLGVPAADLPLSNWFAAMTLCDTVVDGAPQYRAGYEVRFTEEPGAVIEEILKTCSGALSEVGGIWKVRAGPAGLPVFHFTDDDLVLGPETSFAPFGSLNETHNGVSASYPDPDALWQPKEAPPRFNATWEAEDFGRRLVASLTLPACPYPVQVQRLMKAWIEDERRFRRHTLTLPPEAALLEPLDVISWTSAENGYVEKTFEVIEIGDDLGTLVQRLALREVEAGDYDWAPTDLLPWDTPVVTPSRPTPLEPDTFTASGTSISDGTAARRPALRLDWSEEDFELITGVQFEVRRDGTTDVVAAGVMNNPPARKLVVSQGLLPAVAYEVRIAYLAPGLDVIWSPWVSATTPDIRLLPVDLGPEIRAEFQGIAAAAGIASVESLPASGTPNQIVLQLSDFTLYRWDAGTGAWSTALYAGVADSAVTAAKIAAGAVTTDALAAGAVIASKIAAGAVTAEHVLANSLNANVIGAGRLSTEFLEVLTLMRVDAMNAGIAVGKTSAEDYATPGLYVGTDGNEPNPGFSLLAGRQSGDINQYLRIGSDTGLRLLNARHAVTSPTIPVVTDVSTSQTVTLPAGAKRLSLQAVGGGGAGQYVSGSGLRINGASGSKTRVELWDGTTNTGIFWESPGGLGGGLHGGTSHNGASSGFAGGGVGAYRYAYEIGENNYVEYIPASAGAKGSGGGGGQSQWFSVGGDEGYYVPAIPGYGGAASPLLAINNHDISALANPKLVITIGAGGAASGGSAPNQSGAGGNGFVRVSSSSVVEAPADVVPLVPTASGSFVKTGSTAGSFPDLGAGLWVIDTGTANAALNLSGLVIASGQTIQLWAANSASFLSDRTPTYPASSNTRTIFYKFYSMGSWGGA